MKVAPEGETVRPEPKRITLKASSELHYAVRRRALERGQSITEYVRDLLLADLESGGEETDAGK